MKPPIPSPNPERAAARPITGRVEWDEEQQCLLLVYTSGSAWARLRGEWFNGLHNPFAMFGLITGFPFILLVILYGRLASQSRPNHFHIFPWGVRDLCADISGDIAWKDCKQVINRKGDIYRNRRRFYQACLFLSREAFADLDEANRLENALKILLQSDGARWDEVKSTYRKF